MHQDTYFMHFCVKKTHIFYIQNFVELNISSITFLTDVWIFFRIFHLKYCFCRLSVIYLFHIKYFLRPPEKKPNKPHTHIHPPTHTLNKTETHILNYHLRFWHWWFLWRIDKTSGLTKYVGSVIRLIRSRLTRLTSIKTIKDLKWFLI